MGNVNRERLLELLTYNIDPKLRDDKDAFNRAVIKNFEEMDEYLKLSVVDGVLRSLECNATELVAQAIAEEEYRLKRWLFKAMAIFAFVSILYSLTLIRLVDKFFGYNGQSVPEDIFTVIKLLFSS